MKLFVKIFILTAVLISTALGLSGYIMITSSFNNALNRETEIFLNQYQSDKFLFQTALFRNSGFAVFENSVESITIIGGGKILSEPSYSMTFRDAASMAGMETRRISAVFDKDKNAVFSSAANIKLSVSENFKEESVLQTYREIDGNHFIVIESDFNVSGNKYYFVSAADINKIVEQKSEMLMNFTGVYIITMIICLIFTMFFTGLMTRPINKLANTSNLIANGEYDVRIRRASNDEIGILSENFNKMAEAVESRIDALSLGIKQKEDFMSSFAHELKTPLTSVIGYADMIYQKDLPRDILKKSAFYIYNEGMRLEALSLKLLELIILGKQDFIFEEVRAAELIQDSVEAIEFKSSENNVEIFTEIEDSLIKVDYDLIRTLFNNLLDNAVKSGGNRIDIHGKKTGDCYTFKITDNGKGIPENELPRIKEAFYMVDKSRARKQQGAGLGLALAEKIANIHGSALEFESGVNAGTSVTLKLKAIRESGDCSD